MNKDKVSSSYLKGMGTNFPPSAEKFFRTSVSSPKNVTNFNHSRNTSSCPRSKRRMMRIGECF